MRESLVTVWNHEVRPDGPVPSPTNTLAVIRFGSVDGFPHIVDDHLEIPIALTGRPDQEQTESWLTDAPITVETHEDLAVAFDERTLICAGFVPEHQRFAEPVREIYCRALELASRKGFTQIFRMWNYIGRINGTNVDDLEVYQDFCLGRASAFQESNVDSVRMPAATGIGSWGKGISFYFLASRSAVIDNIENPLQVPAYRYPRRYGPSSPSFARATAVGRSDVLYISGTASIRGHKTVFAGDLDLQLETTWSNMRALLDASDEPHSWKVSHLRVYVRRAEHLDRARRFVEGKFPSAKSIGYFNVDICRNDLLVEIEAIAR